MSSTIVTRRGKPPTRLAGKGFVDDHIVTPTEILQEGSTSLSPPPMHSQIAVPTYSDLDRSEAGGNIADVSGFTPDSPSESTEQAEERIRGSATILASILGLMKKPRISGLNELVKNIVA
jgi:hypothetical protein